MANMQLSAKIADYIKEKGTAKLEAFDKEVGKRRKEVDRLVNWAVLERDFAKKRMELEERYQPVNWLSDAATRAWQIKVATHAIKFTHSEIEKSSSLYAVGDESPFPNHVGGVFISTASLRNPKVDMVGNAAVLDVAGLLQLEHEGVTLLNKIESNDASVLKPFASTEDQLYGWLTGFRQVLTSGNPSSHTLAKQLYFPIAKDRYHIVAPLFSSSLAHALYESISFYSFDESAKEARKARREGKFCPRPVVDFPNTARQNFGGTKPQNISILNSVRGGKTFLLSCAPPGWQPQTRPPFGVKTVFSRNHFGLRSYRTIFALRSFLEGQVDKTSTHAVRTRREAYVDELIDLLIQYAAEIQQMTVFAGWSALPECHLTRAEQLWLDPRRAAFELEFAEERDRQEWQKEIADRFAGWLNNRIKSAKLSPGDVEHREWQSLLEEKLRLFKDDLQDYMEVFA